MVFLLMREGIRRMGVVRQTGSAAAQSPDSRNISEEASNEVQLRSLLITTFIT